MEVRVKNVLLHFSDGLPVMDRRRQVGSRDAAVEGC